MTVLDEHLDADTWWKSVHNEEALDTPVREIIDGLEEIAHQAIPYNWLPGRARTFYGTHFVTWADLADESITTLIDRPKGGAGTVKAILIAAREAVTLTRSTPADTDEDLPTTIGRLLDRLSAYDYTVLARRGWALHPQTIPVTARQLGVAPVNVQRNQPRAQRRFTDLLTDPTHAAILNAADELRRRLGPLTCEQAARPALTDVGLDLDDDAGQLLLHLAGPYAPTGPWLQDTTADGLAAATAAVDTALDEHGAPTEQTLTGKLLDLGIPTQTAEAFIASRPGLRRFGDKWVRWGASFVDKTEAALHLSGAPATAAIIAATIGEECHEKAVRDVLYEDRRFTRATKRTWALRRWAIPEYTGLFSEIATRIDAHRHPISTKTIIDDLTAAFPDVAESSIRSYLSAPGFVVESGTVRRRKKSDGWPAVAPLNTVRGTYRNGRNEIRTAITVTAELLRGSGQSLHPALATTLGIHPGAERTFTGDTDITLYWRLSATNGASIGSIRNLATTLDALLGDTIVLIFNTADATVDATLIRADATTPRRLRTLLGKTVRNPITALARALNCDHDEVRGLLKRRGDHDLLSPDEPILLDQPPR